MSTEFKRGNVTVTRFWNQGNRYQFQRDVFTYDELKQVKVLVTALIRHDRTKKIKRVKKIFDK